MKIDIVAERYARALYELEQEEKLGDKLLGELTALVDILNNNKALSDLVTSPLYDILLKKNIMSDIIKKAGLSNYILNLVNLLLEKDRFVFIRDIVDEYIKILDEASGQVSASVKSATELDAVQLKNLSDALSKVLSKKVNIDLSVDRSLIGGVITEVQGIVYDGSVKTQLSKIRESLKGEM